MMYAQILYAYMRDWGTWNNNLSKHTSKVNGKKINVWRTGLQSVRLDAAKGDCRNSSHLAKFLVRMFLNM